MRGEWNRLWDKLWRDNHGNGSDVQESKEVGYDRPRKVPLKRWVSCGREDRKELGQRDADEESGNERDSGHNLWVCISASFHIFLRTSPDILTCRFLFQRKLLEMESLKAWLCWLFRDHSLNNKGKGLKTTGFASSVIGPSTSLTSRRRFNCRLTLADT